MLTLTSAAIYSHGILKDGGKPSSKFFKGFAESGIRINVSTVVRLYPKQLTKVIIVAEMISVLNKWPPELP